MVTTLSLANYSYLTDYTNRESIFSGFIRFERQALRKSVSGLVTLLHKAATPAVRAVVITYIYTVLLKWLDNWLFPKITKIKVMIKLLWPLVIVNMRISGLIWRGTAYFVQNNTTIIPPGDGRRSTRALRCRTLAIHILLQGDTKCFIFFTLYNVIWFLELYIAFGEHIMPSSVRNVTWFQYLFC